MVTGQLTDGVEGNTNFRLDSEDMGIKGYEWVGWGNDTFNNKPIEILFKFDQVRNFSEVRIHANNMFTKEVRVFKKVKVFFSVGGKYFLEEPKEFKVEKVLFPLVLNLLNRD